MICKIHSGSQEAQDASAAPGAPEGKGDEELQLLDSKHVSESGSNIMNWTTFRNQYKPAQHSGQPYCFVIFSHNLQCTK